MNGSSKAAGEGKCTCIWQQFYLFVRHSIPFLKQTVAQPKDWKPHFPVLASAPGNLGNDDLSSLCSGAERPQAAPAPGEGMSPGDLGAMSCQQSCHTWAQCWSSRWPCRMRLQPALERGHRAFTASWVGCSLRVRQKPRK